MDASSDLPLTGRALLVRKHPGPIRSARASGQRARHITHDPRPMRSHRTIFISDTHLGTRGCKAEALADFLAHNECETLFLVGDIVDGWQLKRRWIWPEAHTQVVAEILPQGGWRHARDFRPRQS